MIHKDTLKSMTSYLKNGNPIGLAIPAGFSDQTGRPIEVKTNLQRRNDIATQHMAPTAKAVKMIIKEEGASDHTKKMTEVILVNSNAKDTIVGARVVRVQSVAECMRPKCMPNISIASWPETEITVIV